MRDDTWRCSICNAKKDLSGSHLAGKQSVRSDCWTCATKQSSFMESPSRSTAPDLADMSVSKPNASSGEGSGSSLGATKNPFARTIHTQADTQSPTGNPFFAFATATTPSSKQTLQQRSAASLLSLGDPPPRMSAKAPSASTFPIEMHSAPSNDGQQPSPPFRFVAMPQSGSPSNKLTGELDAAPVWRCSVCFRVKELSGSHLAGKQSVRSDCWVCAKKRVFFLSPSADEISPPPSSTPAKSFNSPQSVAPPTSDTLHWYEPAIPVEAGPHSLLPNVLTLSGPALAASFEGEVLRGYRNQLVKGVRVRTVWHQHNLYVLAATQQSHVTDMDQTETMSHINSSSGAEMAMFSKRHVSMLGEAAATLLAVERKIAASPSRVMRRLFCPDEFTFAAACMYANTFLSDHHDTSAGQSPFIVFGPRVDQTVPRTRWGAIIESCAAARQVVVSGEQRVEGAQSMFCAAGWLTLPLHATAEAIRLAESGSHGQKEKEAEKDEAQEEQALGVDVVLVRETMRLDDLSHAAALAMPVKPF